ncbi:Ionotropic receptor 93a, partial [Frankliniella fusca]
VVVDPHFRSRAEPGLLDALRSFLGASTLRLLQHGGLNVEFYGISDYNLRPELTAVLSIASCADTWAIHRILGQENCLQLAVTEADCPRLPARTALTVPLTERGGDVPQMVLDMKMSGALTWPSAVVLHDKSIDSYLLDRLLAALSVSTADTLPSSVMAYSLPSELSDWKRRRRVEEVLRSLPVAGLARLGERYLVLVGSELVGVVMDVARSLGMVHPLSQWLYVMGDAAYSSPVTLASLLHEGDNVAFVANYTTSRHQEDCQSGALCHGRELLHAFLVALDRSARDEQDLAAQVSDEEWEAIRPAAEERMALLLSHVRELLRATGSCGNCTAWRLRAADTWGLQYSEAPSSAREEEDEYWMLPQPRRSAVSAALVDVGWWRPREGLALQESLFPHAAHGFKGRNLPLVSFHNPPWQVIVSNSSGDVIAYKGVVFEIINELSKSLNFTYSVYYPHPDKPGLTGSTEFYTSAAESEVELNNEFSRNLSWDKIIMNVRENKVFMGAGAFTSTAERQRLVNYTRLINRQPYCMLVVRPRELSRAMLFTSPFTPSTWLCIFLSVVAIGPALNWFHRASPYYDVHSDGRPRRGGLYSVTNCLWYAYGALLQQGGAHLPDADSGRLVVGTWWLVVLVLVTTYCGNLVAALTFPRLEKSITSAEDMVAQGDTLSWGFFRGTPLIEHLKGSTEPRFAAILERGRTHEDEAEVLALVRGGTHVLIDWQVNLLQLMKKDFNECGRCDFSIVKVQDFVEENVAMVMSHDNPYLPIVNQEIRRMQQAGLIEKWLLDNLPKKDRCWTSAVGEANNHSVNLGDMQGSFFVLFFGFLLAGGLLLLECGWRGWHSAKEKKVIKPFVT